MMPLGRWTTGTFPLYELCIPFLTAAPSLPEYLWGENEGACMAAPLVASFAESIQVFFFIG